MSDRLLCAGAKYSEDLPVGAFEGFGYQSSASAQLWIRNRRDQIHAHLGIRSPDFGSPEELRFACSLAQERLGMPYHYAALEDRFLHALELDLDEFHDD